MTSSADYTLRHQLRPGDLGYLVYLHGIIHAQEFGVDATFEAYVAEPMARFVRASTPRERLWIAEHGAEIVGCIAIVEASATEAQLRWFVLQPAARGQGLGKRLMREALAFCRECGFASVFLRTVAPLQVATALYRAAGFVKVEEKPIQLWGVAVTEEKYALPLSAAP